MTTLDAAENQATSISDGFRHPLGSGFLTEADDLGNDTNSNDGYYVFPGQNFNELVTFANGNQSFHLGEDWNAEDDSDLGDSVYAISNGIVIAVVSDQGSSTTGFGNYVLIRHDLPTVETINGKPVSSVYSLYAHLSATAVVAGQLVGIGQPIGALGNSGASEGPHLHLEMTLAPTLPTSDDGYNPSGAPPDWIDPTTFIEQHRTLAPSVNIINGTGGPDTLVGTTGIDQINGFGGNDTIIVPVDDVRDTIDGGADFDSVDYSAYSTSITVTLNNATPTLVIGSGSTTTTSDTIVNIGTFIGGSGNDSIVGDSNNNILSGGSGRDTLVGGEGADRITGGPGDDTIDGGANPQGNGDIVNYNTSPLGVTVNLATGFASDGFGGTDTLISIETVFGSSRRDMLIGSAGNELFEGGRGNDQIDGGGNTNPFGDFVQYVNTATTRVVVNLSTGTASDGLGGTDTLLNIESVNGSRFDDMIIGNGNANLLRGFQGADTMYGGGGNDQLEGDQLSNPSIAGDDTLYGEGGQDTIYGNGGNDTLIGGAGADTLDGGTGTDRASYSTALASVMANLSNPTLNTGDASGDTYVAIEGLIGSNFGDTLVGNASNNTLLGGAGNDRLTGGLGVDTFIYTAGGGIDTITDFQLGVDKIVLAGLPNFIAFSDLVITQVGANAVLTLGSGIELENVNATDLTEDDFIFNQAPTDIELSSSAVAENSTTSTVVGTLTAADSDAGETFTFSLLDDAGGLFAINGTDLVVAGALDYEATASYNVTVRVTDSVDNILDKTITIGITNVNEVPALADAIADQNATEDAPFSFALPADTFADADLGDSLTLAATLADGSPLPGWLTFNPAAGEFFGTPLNADVGEIAIRVTATDGSLASVHDDFTLTVANTNDAPIAMPEAGSAGENETKSFDVLANDTDVDADDSKTLVSIGPVTVSSSNPSIDGINAASALSIVAGQVRFSPGTLFDPLNSGEAATVAVSYTMRDAAGITSSSTLMLAVNGAVEQPIANVINGTPGNDRHLNGSGAADQINGLGGNDTIEARSGDDVIVAGAGLDRVSAGSGNDTFVATVNDGSDLYDGESGSDTIDFSQTSAPVTVSVGTTVLGFTVNGIGFATSAQTGTDILSSIENVIGGSGDDVITGDNLANILRGGAGNDTLSGLRGDDRLGGDAGNDTLIGGRGSDRMTGGTGTDTIVFSAAQSQAGDIDTITDFVIGQDHLQFQRLSVTQLTQADLNGDSILDTSLTLSDGATIRLLSLSCVSDWHALV